MAMRYTKCDLHVTLPEKMVAEILCNLPVKSLIRFRSLSKPCSALIHSPYIVAAHLRRHRHRSSLLLFYFDLCSCDPHLAILPCSEATSLQQLHFPNPQDRVPITTTVAGSCNGLLLLGIHSYSAPLSLAIWNPASRESALVPELPIPGLVPGLYSLGFGFDSKSNDYKVVAFASTSEGRDCDSWDEDEDGTAVIRAMIFSVNAGSWKEPLHELPPGLGLYGLDSVAVAGALYFLGGKAVRELADRKFLFSFDLGSEVFTKVTMPSSWNYSKEVTMRLSVFNDSLALLLECGSDRSSGNAIDVWVMETSGGNHGESWTKMFTLGPFSHSQIPIGIWDGQVILRAWDSNSNDLSLYNFDDKQCRQLPTPSHSGTWVCYEAFSYAESLVPVCSKK